MAGNVGNTKWDLGAEILPQVDSGQSNTDPEILTLSSRFRRAMVSKLDLDHVRGWGA